MKKIKITLMISTALICVNVAQAQTVRIGNTTSGITASGNMLSISNGNNSVQINGVPPIAQGAISVAKEMLSNSDKTDNSKMSQENMEKLDAAQANFLKQQEAVEKENAQINMGRNRTNQEEVKVGQDLRTMKSNLVTNNIGFYNKTTINNFESKALEENPKMYLKFPEYIIKNY